MQKYLIVEDSEFLTHWMKLQQSFISAGQTGSLCYTVKLFRVERAALPIGNSQTSEAA